MEAFVAQTTGGSVAAAGSDGGCACGQGAVAHGLSPPGAPAEAFHSALAAERARSARLFSLLRFVTISVFLALSLLNDCSGSLGTGAS